MLKRFTNVDPNKKFQTDNSSLTNSHGVKLRYRQIQLNCTKFYFDHEIVWPRPHEHTVSGRLCSSLDKVFFFFYFCQHVG